MYDFFKSILMCFGIHHNNNIKKEYTHVEKYQPEGNKFICNDEL